MVDFVPSSSWPIADGFVAHTIHGRVIISHWLGGGGLMLPWVQHGALNSDPNGEAWLGA